MVVVDGRLAPLAAASDFMVAVANLSEEASWITTDDGTHFRLDGAEWLAVEDAPEDVVAPRPRHHVFEVPERAIRLFPAMALLGVWNGAMLHNRARVNAAYLGEGRIIMASAVYSHRERTAVGNAPDELLAAAPHADGLYAMVRRGRSESFERVGEDAAWTPVTLPEGMHQGVVLGAAFADTAVKFDADGKVGFLRLDVPGTRRTLDTDVDKSRVLIRGGSAYIETDEGVQVVDIESGESQTVPLPGELHGFGGGRPVAAGMGAVFPREVEGAARRYYVEGNRVRPLRPPSEDARMSFSLSGELAVAVGRDGTIHSSRDLGATWQEVVLGPGVHAPTDPSSLLWCTYDACAYGDLIIALTGGLARGPAFEVLTVAPRAEVEEQAAVGWECDPEHVGTAAPSLGTVELTGDELSLRWRSGRARQRRSVPIPDDLRDMMEQLESQPSFVVRAATRDAVWVDVRFAERSVGSIVSGKEATHMLAAEDSVRWGQARPDGGLDLLARTLIRVRPTGEVDDDGARHALVVDGHALSLQGGPLRFGVQTPTLRRAFRYDGRQLIQTQCTGEPSGAPLALIQESIPMGMFTALTTLGIRMDDVPCLEFVSTIHGTVRPAGEGVWEGPRLRCEVRVH